MTRSRWFDRPNRQLARGIEIHEAIAYIWEGETHQERVARAHEAIDAAEGPTRAALKDATFALRWSDDDDDDDALMLNVPADKQDEIEETFERLKQSYRNGAPLTIDSINHDPEEEDPT